MNRPIGAVVVGLFLFILACNLSGCSSNKKYQTLTLPSGKIIKVRLIWTNKVLNEAPVLVLDYETDLKLANKAALREEVKEIWSVFRSDVEKGKFNKAAITAHEAAKRYLFLEPPPYRFTYEKQQDGTWICTERQKG